MSNEKLPKAEYNGELKFGKINITCAVLNDENHTRVLSERSVGDSIGTKASAAYWKQKKTGNVDNIPQYLAAESIRPYINDELIEKLAVYIKYISKGGRKANGIKAENLSIPYSLK